MADHKALPVFAFLSDIEQLVEIRQYLISIGATTLDPKGPTDVSDNLIQICKQLPVLGTKGYNEVDMVLNSVCSLIVSCPEERAFAVVGAFCSAITPKSFTGHGWNSNAGSGVRVLSNLYRGFAAHSTIQWSVYRSLVQMCAEGHLIGDLDCSTEVLEKQFDSWGTDVEGKREILRLVHAALLADERADQAAKVMLMLLSTYTEADATAAREDAIECVRTAVVDPWSFSFDHLQRLHAVRALEKSDPTMYSALELFISGTLKDYQTFVKKHPKFVSEKLNVDENVLVKKIRLLTLMTIAENSNVIELDTLGKELDLSADDALEEFLIDAIQVNAISGKLNEMTRTLVVTSFQHRQFGKDQWNALQKRLQGLIASVRQAHANTQDVNQHLEEIH